jgi:hypothetical protein
MVATDYRGALDADIASCLRSLQQSGPMGTVVAIGPVLGAPFFHARFPRGRRFAEICDRLVRDGLAETARDTIRETDRSRYELRVRLTTRGTITAHDSATTNGSGGPT